MGHRFGRNFYRFGRSLLCSIYETKKRTWKNMTWLWSTVVDNEATVGPEPITYGLKFGKSTIRKPYVSSKMSSNSCQNFKLKKSSLLFLRFRHFFEQQLPLYFNNSHINKRGQGTSFSILQKLLAALLECSLMRFCSALPKQPKYLVLILGHKTGHTFVLISRPLI